LVHEESGERERKYRGWQWSDVDIHQTKLLRLVIEGISEINVKTRHSTFYLLKDRTAVKNALNTNIQF
jgi:hypothetical protein